MNRRIVMDRGNVVKIAKTMNCTREMVSKALNFKKDSTGTGTNTGGDNGGNGGGSNEGKPNEE